MYGCNMPQAGPLLQPLLHFQLEQMSPISQAQILSPHTHSPISTVTQHGTGSTDGNSLAYNGTRV